MILVTIERKLVIVNFIILLLSNNKVVLEYSSYKTII